MTTALVVAAALIFVAGLFAVIVERTNERDQARYEVERLEAEVLGLCEDNMRMAADLVDAYGQLQDAANSSVAEVIQFPTQRTPIHDDLAVEQLRAELNDEWFSRLHGWGESSE